MGIWEQTALPPGGKVALCLRTSLKWKNTFSSTFHVCCSFSAFLQKGRVLSDVRTWRYGRQATCSDTMAGWNRPCLKRSSSQAMSKFTVLLYSTVSRSKGTQHMYSNPGKSLWTGSWGSLASWLVPHTIPNTGATLLANGVDVASNGRQFSCLEEILAFFPMLASCDRLLV